MQTVPSTHRFEVLDGLRGVAAVAVLLLHTGFVVQREIARSGYLGVDLFFSLSGFVVAYSYGARIRAGLGWWAFFKIRLIRLYPVYFVGVAAGGAFLLLQAIHAPRAHSLTRIGVSTLSALLFLPTPPRFSIDAKWLFPANVPAWSLCFELMANLAYVAYARRPKLRVLLGIVAASGVLLLLAARAFGHLELGPRWVGMQGGVVRTLFSFFSGVLVHHVWQRRRGVCPVPALVWLGALALLFATVGRHVVPAELACVFVGFPLLVYGAALTPSSGRQARLFGVLGRLSYPLYTVQMPILGIGMAVEQRSHLLTRHWLAATVMVLVLVTAAAVLVERYCDLPARRWIRRRRAVLLVAAAGD